VVLLDLQLGSSKSSHPKTIPTPTTKRVPRWTRFVVGICILLFSSLPAYAQQIALTWIYDWGAVALPDGIATLEGRIRSNTIPAGNYCIDIAMRCQSGCAGNTLDIGVIGPGDYYYVGATQQTALICFDTAQSFKFDVEYWGGTLWLDRFDLYPATYYTNPPTPTLPALVLATPTPLPTNIKDSMNGIVQNQYTCCWNIDSSYGMYFATLVFGVAIVAMIRFIKRFF